MDTYLQWLQIYGVIGIGTRQAVYAMIRQVSLTLRTEILSFENIDFLTEITTLKSFTRCFKTVDLF